MKSFLATLSLTFGLLLTGCMAKQSESGLSDHTSQASLPNPDDGHYLVVFGFQGSGPFNLPANAHTYASFFAVRHDVLGRAILTDSHTISWLPVDGVINVVVNNAKPGRNYTLKETTLQAQAQNRAMRHSGFHKIDPSLYEMLKERKLKLDEGSATNGIFYQANSTMPNRQKALAWAHGQSATSGVTNCIHAVADAIREPGDQLLDTGIKRGFAASDAVFASFAPWRLSQLPTAFDTKLVQALIQAEADGEVVLGGGSGEEEEEAESWRTLQTLTFAGPSAVVNLTVADNPFVKDVLVTKTGSCGPSGTFLAVVKVGPGSNQFGPTVQNASDPRLWHPNGGAGRKLNLVQLTLQSPFAGLNCKVKVDIR